MTSETQEARQHREEADRLPDGDVVAVVLRHHADITDALERLKGASGETLASGWEALKKFLKAHETAEQQVVRPVIERGDDPAEAHARIAEEQEADEAVARLSSLGTDSPEFAAKLAEFAGKVHEHAEAEEHDELPLLKQLPVDRRIEMGTKFLASFDAAS
jgi:hypothetical protein